MNTDASSNSPNPAPHADKVALGESFFALFGGPSAWLLQLCGGFALASQPCFLDGDRRWLPRVGTQWSWSVLLALMSIAVFVALFALFISWRAYRRTRFEQPGDSDYVMDVGAGRTRFLALWGILLATGSAVATATTAFAFIFVVRCSG